MWSSRFSSFFDRQICNRIYRMRTTGDISGFPFVATVVKFVLHSFDPYLSKTNDPFIPVALFGYCMDIQLAIQRLSSSILLALVYKCFMHWPICDIHLIKWDGIAWETSRVLMEFRIHTFVRLSQQWHFSRAWRFIYNLLLRIIRVLLFKQELWHRLRLSLCLVHHWLRSYVEDHLEDLIVNESSREMLFKRKVPNPFHYLYAWPILSFQSNGYSMEY